MFKITLYNTIIEYDVYYTPKEEPSLSIMNSKSLASQVLTTMKGESLVHFIACVTSLVDTTY